MTITTITPMTKGPTVRPNCDVKNILVTGGAGFIGSWMCHHLIHQYGEQYSVVCLDKLSNVSTLNNLKSVLDRPNFHFVQGNLHDKERLIKIMDEYNIDSVIHFAAESSVQKSFSDPAAFVDMNVCATFRLLEAMNTHGKITTFVHASTDEVYGETWGVSVDEDTRMNPTNPYAASKAAAEMFVMAYRKSFDIPGMILRCNNIYGPCQYPEKLIPKSALLARDGQKLTIQGNGSRTRNFVHVADVIAAYDMVLHKGVPGGVYNVSSSDEVSVRDVAIGVLGEFGHDKRGELDKFIVPMPDRPYNDNDYVVKGDRLKELGWSQSVCFKEGLADTVQWYRENGNNWWKEALGNQISV
ncbi:dTDP-D-glucose 4,6-dehydratase [Aspergillus neoniger CBS 115656]|uniref:dTDP-D-glucose 4,6-dehydratase n=1 Tax=Aspergillus neoniger (strain CBS 115656) TaxID=1448310 RepID=A0A318Y6D7_ASPNB|nr:dTDP-D-glucose 4,6-dehydratase [Aspergillus neoniger CBS 115656]PYH29865.1 dTDP-D-glucose 4,6-dehydratase [Aspergillus neoniger CBS 115656]